jgi:hypothetical protein
LILIYFIYIRTATPLYPLYSPLSLTGIMSCINKCGWNTHPDRPVSRHLTTQVPRNANASRDDRLADVAVVGLAQVQRAGI